MGLSLPLVLSMQVDLQPLALEVELALAKVLAYVSARILQVKAADTVPGAAALVGALPLQVAGLMPMKLKLQAVDLVPLLAVDLAVVGASALGWLTGWVFSELLLPLPLLTPRIALAQVPEQGMSLGVLPFAICLPIHDLLEFLGRLLCLAEKNAAQRETADEAFVCHFGLRTDPPEAASAPLCHAQRSTGALQLSDRRRRIPEKF